MDIEEARAIKIAVEYLNEDINGQVLLEHLEDMAGQFAPNYNRESGTSIILAAGRTELVQTLRNFKRLTAEQIIDLLEG